MSFIKDIQEKLGRFKLKKEQKRLQRNIKAFSLDKATSVGVLYDATNRNDAETVKLWRTMNEWVYNGFDITYKKLGVDFDKIYYESENNI